MGKTAAAPLVESWRDAVAATKKELDDAKSQLAAARRRRRDHIRELVDVQGRTQREVAAAYGISEPHVIRILADQTP